MLSSTSNSSHAPCSESSNFQKICSISYSKTVRFQLIPINTDALLDTKPFNFLFTDITILLPKSPVYGRMSRSRVRGRNYGSRWCTIPMFRWNLLTPSSWVLLHAHQTAQRHTAEGSSRQIRCNTVGRTPLDEWSARHRDLYPTTPNTHNRQTSMPRWDSNPRSQQASVRRPTHQTARPLGPAKSLPCEPKFTVYPFSTETSLAQQDCHLKA